MVDYRDETVMVGDLPVHLLHGGTGNPVLFLHGADHLGNWTPYLDQLARHFYIYAPDHPGFAQTPQPDWLEGIDDLVLHYLDLLDVVGLTRPHVVGHCVGGWIAAELAVSHSDKLDKLVLVDAAGLLVESVQFPELFMVPAEEVRNLLYSHPEQVPVPPLPIEELQDRRLRSQVTLARIGWNPYLHNPKLGRRLQRITAPTQIVWGADDRLLPIEVAHAFHERIAGSALTVIPDCRHAPPIEQTQRFVDAVVEFLAPESSDSRLTAGSAD